MTLQAPLLGHYRASHLSRLQQPELSSGLGSHHQQRVKRSLRICDCHSAADPNKPSSGGPAITPPPLCSLDPTYLLTSHPRPPRTLASPHLKEIRKSKDMGRCPLGPTQQLGKVASSGSTMPGTHVASSVTALYQRASTVPNSRLLPCP